MISIYFHQPTRARFVRMTSGNRWIAVHDANCSDVRIQVETLDFARQLESAARACAEALEQEARDEALSAQGTLTDHESATGNEERTAVDAAE